MTTIGVLVAIGIGLVLAIIAFVLFRRADAAADNLQRRLNRLENLFAQAGSTWMAEFLEDMVVGDESVIMHKLKDLYEATNTVDVFMDKIGMPIASFALRNATPEQMKKLLANINPATLKELTREVSNGK